MATSGHSRKKERVAADSFRFTHRIHCGYPLGFSWCLVKVFIAGFSDKRTFCDGGYDIIYSAEEINEKRENLNSIYSIIHVGERLTHATCASKSIYESSLVTRSSTGRIDSEGSLQMFKYKNKE